MDNNSLIQLEIEKELDTSEILISWSQLGFSIFMLSLWAISLYARKYSPEYEVVHFFLGGYALISTLKLYFSYKTKISNFFLYLSILLDVSIVSILLWSFHIQYDQPPGLYLKAPTFIYYFYFISLRTLRYEAKYIITTGFLSAISWMVLVLYALGDESSVITRSFVDYTKSHDILVGAEVEKLIGIFVFTIILAIAVSRKKRLLQTSKEDNLTKSNMTKFFSDDVAKSISFDSSSLIVGNGVIREATILMVDLRNFTKITAGWGPEKILSVISDYQEIIVPIILKNGGSIDKYMGDGIFAHFGASSASSTYAKDIISAMLEINLATEMWSQERKSRDLLPIDIGQASYLGEVLFGTTGSKTRLEYTTIGTAVNNAAKMEKHTKFLGVKSITTLETFEKAFEQGLVCIHDSIVLKDQKVEGISEGKDLIILDTYKLSK